MNDTSSSRILLSPDTAAVLIVDGQVELDLALGNSNDSDSWDILTSILKRAEELSVPVVSTVFSGLNGNNSEPITAIARLTHLPRSELNAWENARVREKLSELGRDAIVVAGNCLEGGVSFAALGALEFGYQSYIVVDAIRAATELDVKTALARMAQAGVITVTSRQLLLEWSR